MPALRKDKNPMKTGMINVGKDFKQMFLTGPVRKLRLKSQRLLALAPPRNQSMEMSVLLTLILKNYQAKNEGTLALGLSSTRKH